MTNRVDLEDRVETTWSWYIGCHGAYWNAVRFGPGPVRKSVGSWPLPCIPSYSDAEKEAKRLEMERCKSMWGSAVDALKVFDAEIAAGCSDKYSGKHRKKGLK